MKTENNSFSNVRNLLINTNEKIVETVITLEKAECILNDIYTYIYGTKTETECSAFLKINILRDYLLMAKESLEALDLSNADIELELSKAEKEG